MHRRAPPPQPDELADRARTEVAVRRGGWRRGHRQFRLGCAIRGAKWSTAPRQSGTV